MRIVRTTLLLGVICGLVFAAGCAASSSHGTPQGRNVQRLDLGGLVVTIEPTSSLPMPPHPSPAGSPQESTAPLTPMKGKKLVALITTATNPTNADIYMWVGPDQVLTDSSGTVMQVTIADLGGASGEFNYGPTSASPKNQGLHPGGSIHVSAEWEVPVGDRDFTFTWNFGPKGIASFHVH